MVPPSLSLSLHTAGCVHSVRWMFFKSRLHCCGSLRTLYDISVFFLDRLLSPCDGDSRSSERSYIADWKFVGCQSDLAPINRVKLNDSDPDLTSAD